MNELTNTIYSETEEVNDNYLGEILIDIIEQNGKGYQLTKFRTSATENLNPKSNGIFEHQTILEYCRKDDNSNDAASSTITEGADLDSLGEYGWLINSPADDDANVHKGNAIHVEESTRLMHRFIEKMHAYDASILGDTFPTDLIYEGYVAMTPVPLCCDKNACMCPTAIRGVYEDDVLIATTKYYLISDRLRYTYWTEKNGHLRTIQPLPPID